MKKVLSLILAVVMLLGICVPLTASAETQISSLKFNYNFKENEALHFTVPESEHVNVTSCYFRGSDSFTYNNGAIPQNGVQLELYCTVAPQSGYTLKSTLDACTFNGVSLTKDSNSAIGTYRMMSGGAIQVHVKFSLLTVEDASGKNIDKSGVVGYHITGELMDFGAIEAYNENGHFASYSVDGDAGLKFTNKIDGNQVTMGEKNSTIIANFVPHNLTTQVITKSKIGVEGKCVKRCSKCAYEQYENLPFVDMELEGFDDGFADSKPLYYNGENQYLGLVLSYDGTPLSKEDYTIQYPAESKEVGRYTATVTVHGKYFEDTRTFEYEIFLGKPKVTAKAGVNAITLSWKKVAGATAYRVYGYNVKTGKYTKIADTKSLTYTRKNRTAGTRYVYLVRAIGKDNAGATALSPYSAADNVSIYTLCSAPKAAVSVSGKTVTLKWAKVQNAKFYRVYRYNIKTKKYTNLVKSTAKLTVKLAGQPKGNNYYLVRAFNKGGVGSNYTTKNLTKAVVR